jgi:hypothetical protein
MNDDTIDHEPTDEDTFIYEVSDEALEAAAGPRAFPTMGAGSCVVAGGMVC